MIIISTVYGKERGMMIIIELFVFLFIIIIIILDHDDNDNNNNDNNHHQHNVHNKIDAQPFINETVKKEYIILMLCNRIHKLNR